MNAHGTQPYPPKLDATLSRTLVNPARHTPSEQQYPENQGVSPGPYNALLTIGTLVYTVLAWRNGYCGIAFRVHYTLVMVSAVAFVWFLNQWNLLGWRY